jgi:hypothetical protein
LVRARGLCSSFNGMRLEAKMVRCVQTVCHLFCSTRVFPFFPSVYQDHRLLTLWTSGAQWALDALYMRNCNQTANSIQTTDPSHAASLPQADGHVPMPGHRDQGGDLEQVRRRCGACNGRSSRECTKPQGCSGDSTAAQRQTACFLTAHLPTGGTASGPRRGSSTSRSITWRQMGPSFGRTRLRRWALRRRTPLVRHAHAQQRGSAQHAAGASSPRSGCKGPHAPSAH